MNYLLDTSAVLAHYHREPGSLQVQALFDQAASTILLAAPSMIEIDTALKVRISDEGQRRVVLDSYAGRLARVVPLDHAAAVAAISVKATALKRLPAMDALIAGCAVASGATLVHRDPHFDAVPAGRLKTLRLSDTADPAPSDVPPVVKESSGAYAVRKGKGRKRN